MLPNITPYVTKQLSAIGWEKISNAGATVAFVPKILGGIEESVRNMLIKENRVKLTMNATMDMICYL